MNIPCEWCFWPCDDPSCPYSTVRNQASPRPLTNQQKIMNLLDALAEDILSMTDDEGIAEMIEDGLDPEAEAAKVREVIQTAIDKSKAEK